MDEFTKVLMAIMCGALAGLIFLGFIVNPILNTPYKILCAKHNMVFDGSKQTGSPLLHNEIVGCLNTTSHQFEYFSVSENNE